jgi:ribosomal protein L11 methyltransferase
MKRPDLWQVTLRTASEAEDIVLDILEPCFGQPVSIYHDFDAGHADASVFLNRPPPRWRFLRKQLQRDFQRALLAGGRVGAVRIQLKRVPAASWTDSWKRHCPPFQVGGRLLVKPSWSRRVPKHGQAVLVIDPGLSFGTGHHPTTRFCLEQIVKRSRSQTGQAFLDMGAGSGILAMAAARLGYGTVEAFDVDPEAVRVATENIEVNGLTERIRVRQKDLTRFQPKRGTRYALVCANLLSDLLIKEANRIVKCLDKNGFLVIAGILAAEFAAVQYRYEAAGLRLAAAKSQGEWRSGCFQRGF